MSCQKWVDSLNNPFYCYVPVVLLTMPMFPNTVIHFSMNQCCRMCNTDGVNWNVGQCVTSLIEVSLQS